MDNIDVTGLSGLINFDIYGRRTDFQMNVLELRRTGLEKIGTSTKKSEIKFYKSYVHN